MIESFSFISRKMRVCISEFISSKGFCFGIISAVRKKTLPARASFALFVFVLLCPDFLLAGELTNSVSPSVRVEKIYRAAQIRFQSEPNNPEAAWQFARACFDCADAATKDSERERLANEGIAASRRLLAREPKLAVAHYYLGMNLGQLAQTKLLGALKLVDEMETEFERARELDEKIDFAGPDRNLGMLYFDAPGWPTSVGSRSKAKKHMLRAVQLSPDYPENYLNLLEAYLKWGDRVGLESEAQKLPELWFEARKKLSGEAWESSWTDWQKRWENIQKKMNRKPKSASPHSK